MGDAEKTWLTLIGLTFVGALLAETGHSGWPLALTVAFLIAFKGRMVIDHYMEMRSANTRIRRVLKGFVTLVPLLVLASQGWGTVIRRLTSLD